MSLKSLVAMTQDNGLIERCAAAAALAGRAGDARLWVTQHMWQLAATDGWATVYADGLTAEAYTGDPAAYVSTVGADPDVITDAAIITAVGSLIAAEAAAVPSDEPPTE